MDLYHAEFAYATSLPDTKNRIYNNKLELEAGFQDALHKNKKLGMVYSWFSSLKTILPIFFIRRWGLKAGDKLNWSWEVVNGEMVIVIRKVQKDKK